MKNKTLTIYDIVESFPGECKTILPREIRRLKKELKPYFSNLERIQEDYTDDFERHFFYEVAKIFIPQKDNDLYERLLKIQRLYRQRVSDVKAGKPERKRLDVDRAKAQPIEDLYDFEKKRTTQRNVYAVCPFHNGNSFVIYTDSNTFICFGCNEKGDSIDFIMLLHGDNFIDAVKRLGG